MLSKEQSIAVFIEYKMNKASRFERMKPKTFNQIRFHEVFFLSWKSPKQKRTRSIKLDTPHVERMHLPGHEKEDQFKSSDKSHIGICKKNSFWIIYVITI